MSPSPPCPTAHQRSPQDSAHAAQVLAAWQLAQMPGLETLKPLQASDLIAPLAAFSERCLQPHLPNAQSDPQRRAFHALTEHVVASVLAQAPVALQAPPLAPQSATDRGWRGPISWDLARHLGPISVEPEAEALGLDACVRYWEQAKALGLAVASDMGSFYTTVQWTQLLQALCTLGNTPDDPTALRACWALCSRYDELRPLRRLLERVPGLVPAQGWAFGRM